MQQYTKEELETYANRAIFDATKALELFVAAKYYKHDVIPVELYHAEFAILEHEVLKRIKVSEGLVQVEPL